MSFRYLAALLLPSSPEATGRVVDADERWTNLPGGGAEEPDAVVWGRQPSASDAPLASLLTAAAAREAVFTRVRIKPPTPFTAARVHRWPPARYVTGYARNTARRILFQGAVVEMSRARGAARVIDAVAHAAGAVGRPTRFHPGSGGSALVTLQLPHGAQYLLRAAPSGSPVDPQRAAAALQHLAPRLLPEVPRLRSRGKVAGASWSTESVLGGRPPGRLSRMLVSTVVDFCARLPRLDRPSSAPLEHLHAIAAMWPARTHLLLDVAAHVSDCAEALPAVTGHGDLWRRNLLTRRRRLSGVVDWDAWHPSAFPGTDLLQLIAKEQELKTHAAMGQVWSTRPWASRSFVDSSREYWRRFGLKPTERVLYCVGLAWWAGQVAGNITRLPRLVDDERWVENNVDNVIGVLEKGIS